MPTTSFAHRVVRRPASAVMSNLPGGIAIGGCNVRIHRGDPKPAAGPGAHRLRLTWQARKKSGTGFLEVMQLSPHATQVDVALHGPFPRRVDRDLADALAREVRDRLEGRAPLPAALHVVAPRRRAWRAALATGVLAILALVIWLPRPTPVSVEAAVERYAADAASATAAHTESSREPTAVLPVAAPATPPASSAPPATAPRSSGEAAVDDPAPPPDAEARSSEGPVAPAAHPPPESAPPAATEPARRGPEPGVYRYATSGWEEISAPGSRRSFPEETTQTVLETACGHTSRWTPFEERTDELAFCHDEDHQVLDGIRGYREFYRFRVEQDFTCSTTARDGNGGWTARCADDDTVVHVEARVLGPAQVEVGGRAVPARQLEITSRFEGATTGRRHARSWVDEHGLLLRTQVEAELQTEGPFGRVTYREEHRLDLLDVAPRR